MIMEIHVLPTPSGTLEEQYAHVNEAVRVIREAGLTHEVNALGTVIEGNDDELWAVARAVHEATLTSGADSVMTTIRLVERRGQDMRMADMVAPFRTND